MAARRTGVIHAWGADAPPPPDFSLAPDRPVPVFVRDPLTRAVVGRGTVAGARVEGGQLWADVDWPEDVERLAGDSTPSARCKFDEAGRLVRVVVELDDADPEGGWPDPETIPPGAPDPHESPDPLPDDRRAAEAGDRPTPEPRQAAMAAETDRDPQTRDNLASRPGRDPANTAPAPAPADPESLEKENARLRSALKETNRKAEADRRYREEREAEEARRKEEQLPEVEKFRSKADAESEARRQAEQRAAQAEARLVEMRLEGLVQGEARKAGFLYPEVAYKLIDRSRLEYDPEIEKWDGVAAAVEKLARDLPDLVRSRKPGPGSPPRDEHPGNPPRRNGRPGGAESQDPFAAFASDLINHERM